MIRGCRKGGGIGLSATCAADYWSKFDITPKELMSRAKAYRERAYAPYSKFPVGAAVLMDDGSVFGGCNVENASFGVTICAERVAMSSAVAAGKTGPLAIAVAGGLGVFCSPCGACRQFLSEFNPRLEVLLMKEGEIASFSLDILLPHHFKLEDH